MENKTLWTAALMLFLAASAAAQVHDIEVAAGYSESVDGIRLTYNGTAIMDEVANLSVGRIYEIRYKIRNLGDYSEKANISAIVVNRTHVWSINLRSRAVDAKKSLYLSEKWDTTSLFFGNYSIRVHASILDDVNSSNDLGVRNVTLWKSSTIATTSRTTTSAAPTTSSTSTSRAEEEDEDATTSTSRKTTTTISKTTMSAAVLPSSTSTTELPTTSSRTTSLRRTATSEKSTSSSAAVNAAAGKVTSVPAEGRQTLVVFVVLLAGAVLYLSKR